MAHSSSRPESGNGSFTANVNTADASSPVTVRSVADATKKMLIADVVITTDTATNIRLEDGDGTDILGPLYMPANSVYSKRFDPGLICPTNKALNVLAGAAGNITVTVTGYDID